VAGWISETMTVRKAAQARLGLTEAPPERMSEEQLAAIVDAFGGLLGLLRRADQHDRAEIYTRIGLQMIYRPGTETVLAEVRSKDLDRVPVMCPEGDLNPHAR
jgi:site-specific DNA recombinase